MEHADRIGPCPHRHEHVAELRTGRIGDDALDVVLNEADGRGKERGGGAEEHHDGLRVGRELEQRRQPRHHEHAGRHHGRGVDQRGNRRRAFHRVRQPGVQQELGRFAHRAHEQQQAGQRQRIGMPAEEVDGLARQPRRSGEDRLEIRRVEQHEDGEDAQREAEIADAVDDKGLDRRRVRRGLVVPEADQEIAGETDTFPAEEQLDQIVSSHQHQHRKGEQRQIGKEPRPIRILVHVADGIEVHEGRDGVDHHQHHGGQRIDAQRPRYLQVAGIDPREQRYPGVVVHEADIDQRHPGQRRGNE